MRMSLIVALAACQAPRELPWLHGLDQVVSSTGSVTPRADDIVDLGCSIGATRTVELVANVSPAAGNETVVASYRDGISVFDSEDHVIAETPGYPCEGSADELDVMAFGVAYGEPTLVIVATSGGHRETATWLSLFHTGRTLDAVFTGVVETRTDTEIERGAVHLFPGGLLYLLPDGRSRFWRLDPGARIYVPVLPELPHDEPAV